MIRNTIYLILALTIICSCQSSNIDSDFPYQEENGKVFSDSITFDSLGSFIMPIDSLTPLQLGSLQPLSTDTSDILTYYNSNNKLIYQYSISKSKYLKSIVLPMNIAKGIGSTSDDVFYSFKNKDTIIVCNNSTQKIFFLDSNGIVKKEIALNLSMKKGKNEAIAFPTNLSPIKSLNDEIIIPGFLVDPTIKDHTKVNGFIIVNVKNNSITSEFSRPELYNKGNWGYNGSAFLSTITYNTTSKKWIYGFSVDPYIYETDRKATLQKHYISSKYFNQVLPPSKDLRKEYKPEEALFQSRTTANYLDIIYDKFHNLYYRLVLLPLSKKDGSDKSKVSKRKLSILVFNNKFIKKGEYLIDDCLRYQVSNIFLTTHGLNFPLATKDQKDENSIKIIQFKPIQIK